MACTKICLRNLPRTKRETEGKNGSEARWGEGERERERERIEGAKGSRIAVSIVRIFERDTNQTEQYQHTQHNHNTKDERVTLPFRRGETTTETTTSTTIRQDQTRQDKVDYSNNTIQHYTTMHESICMCVVSSLYLAYSNPIPLHQSTHHTTHPISLSLLSKSEFVLALVFAISPYRSIRSVSLSIYTDRPNTQTQP